MEPNVRTRIGELGLDAADLLQYCRAILLVEGQHELVVLEALLGDSLQELGIEMMCMRGATALKTWDAQLIERFTDVPVVVLVDNDQAEGLHDVWDRARSAAAAGEPYFEIIDELKTKGRGSEGEFLRELCKNLITKQQPERYHITAFDKADIPQYLALNAAPDAPSDATWDHLKNRPHGKRFKPWMEKTFNADYSDENLRTAALRLDAVPDDFARLLDFIRAEVLDVEQLDDESPVALNRWPLGQVTRCHSLRSTLLTTSCPLGEPARRRLSTSRTRPQGFGTARLTTFIWTNRITGIIGTDTTTGGAAIHRTRKIIGCKDSCAGAARCRCCGWERSVGDQGAG